MKQNDQEPLIGIKSEDSGITYFPKFKKNTKGEWELADRSFLKTLKPHTVLKKPAEKDKD